MMRAAQELGLGTCWVMYFDAAKVTDLFSLPEHIVPVAMLPVGYPAEDVAPSPMHGTRFPLDDIIIK